MNNNDINEKHELCKIKIHACEQLFKMTKNNGYLNDNKKLEINNAIGKIKQNLFDELELYQDFDKQTILGLTFQINPNMYNSIVKTQKKLIKELIKILNNNEITNGYKSRMINIIQNILLDDNISKKETFTQKSKR